jgi:hypothetical protein
MLLGAGTCDISDSMLITCRIDYGADVTVVPYILNEFAYFFETPYTNYDATFPT